MQVGLRPGTCTPVLCVLLTLPVNVDLRLRSHGSVRGDCGRISSAGAWTLDHNALLTRPTATVRRDGLERTLAQDQMVLGDMLRAAAGDQIVRDGRVLALQMQVDELWKFTWGHATGDRCLSASAPATVPCASLWARDGGAVQLAICFCVQGH